MMSPSAPRPTYTSPPAALHAHGHLAERVDAAGHGVLTNSDRSLSTCDLIDGLVHRIDRAGANRTVTRRPRARAGSP